MLENKSSHPVHIAEGSQREQLAAYFLSMPPYREQTPAEQICYRRHLREIGELDNRQVLEAAGSNRPLTFGNPVLLLQNLFTAAQQLAAAVGQPLMIFPAREADFHFQALIHPRLLCLAGVNILRIACTAAPRQPVWVRIEEQADCLRISATAAAAWHDPMGQAVIEECARLHGGNLTHSEKMIGFTCGRALVLPSQIHPCPEQTAIDFCNDPLSPVWTGFYAWLSSAEDSDCSEEAFPSAMAQPTASANNPSTPSERNTSDD